jgi:hypothetical protein
MRKFQKKKTFTIGAYVTHTTPIEFHDKKKTPALRNNFQKENMAHLSKLP